MIAVTHYDSQITAYACRGMHCNHVYNYFGYTLRLAEECTATNIFAAIFVTLYDSWRNALQPSERLTC
jgi:hypothetical protein